MCEPTTILMAVAAISAYQSSEANNTSQRYNAAVADANAKTSEFAAQDALARGEQDAISQGRKTAALRGAQRATLAARGMDLGYGTPQSLVDQTDYFGQVDTNTLRDNAGKESWAKNVEASNFRTQAAAARASQTDSVMAAGKSLLTSYVMVNSKWTPTTSTPAAGAAGSWAGNGDLSSGLSGGAKFGGQGFKAKW